jgi:hypothetical protein
MVDGSEVAGGPVTHNAQMGMTINHHEEDIRLHCITVGNVPVILGLLWLKLHNAIIDWYVHRLSFHSNKYVQCCLAASLQATMVAEEWATKQYYRKTPGINEREDDPREICNTVTEKIKKTEKDMPGKPEDIVPKNITSSWRYLRVKNPPSHHRIDIKMTAFHCKLVQHHHTSRYAH